MKPRFMRALRSTKARQNSIPNFLQAGKRAKMHTTLVRAQNVFGFFTTVVSVVAVLMAISVVVFPTDPSADIAIRNVQVSVGRPSYYSRKREEMASIKFDLEADLTSLFNWNTKQVFVYLVASWPSAQDPNLVSEAVIWDQIIPGDPLQNPFIKGKKEFRRKSADVLKPQRGKVQLSKQRGKYQVSDVSGLMAEKSNATLQLGWNVQPHVGVLTWTTHTDLGKWKSLKGGRSEAFRFPPLKSTKKKPASTK